MRSQSKLFNSRKRAIAKRTGLRSILEYPCSVLICAVNHADDAADIINRLRMFLRVPKPPPDRSAHSSHTAGNWHRFG